MGLLRRKRNRVILLPAMPDPSINKIALEQLDVQKQIEVNTAPGTEQPGRSLPATTTMQEDMVTAGQRHINLMWEGTQKNIALWVTCVALAVCATLIVYAETPEPLRLMAFTTLSNVFFAVTSVYFTRTNHTKIGGIGNKPGEAYVGR